MRKLLVILLILSLVLPVAALADTPYANDAMGLTLSVPDGWTVNDMGSVSIIVNEASQSVVFLLAQAFPGIKAALPATGQVLSSQLISQLAPVQGMEVLSIVNDSDSENPVIGMSYTGEAESVLIFGLMCLYASDDDTMAMALLAMPADNSPDVSWFTDPLEAMFPALAGV